MITEVENVGTSFDFIKLFFSPSSRSLFPYSFTLHTFFFQLLLIAGIDHDEEDILQCGKCKSQFTSLHLFILHKKEHVKLQEQTVDISQYLSNHDDRVDRSVTECQENVQFASQETFVEADPLGEPIILEESDMLFR